MSHNSDAQLIHIITKTQPDQSDSEAFDIYQLGCMSNGYSPEESWSVLRSVYLADDPLYRHRFITYDVLPPITTSGL